MALLLRSPLYGFVDGASPTINLKTDCDEALRQHTLVRTLRVRSRAGEGVPPFKPPSRAKARRGQPLTPAGSGSLPCTPP